MPSGSITTDLTATPEQVWAIVSDLESAPEWVPDMVSARRLDSGPLQVGAQFEQVMRVQGRKVTAKVQVAEYREGEVFAHSGEGGPVKFGGRFELTPMATGCRVVNSWWLELSGMFKLASPMAANWARNNIEQSMKALDELLKARHS